MCSLGRGENVFFCPDIESRRPQMSVSNDSACKMLGFLQLPHGLLCVLSGIWITEMQSGSSRPMKCSSLWRRKMPCFKRNTLHYSVLRFVRLFICALFDFKLSFFPLCTDIVKRPGETLRPRWPGCRSMPALVPTVLVSGNLCDL